MSTQKALDLLLGAIDMHTHSSPSIYSRPIDDIDLAREARELGMRAVVLKAHEGETASRATLVQKAVPGIAVFGGIALNSMVGGLNPYAVESALKLGARIVWMPTVTAHAHHLFVSHHSPNALKEHSQAQPSQGIRILDESGQVVAPVMEILDLVAKANVVLATGHISEEEIRALLPRAREAGVQKFMVTHADFPLPGMSTQAQKELADVGVWIEKCYISCIPQVASITPEEMAMSIRTIGAAQCVLTTDFGQPYNPHPPAGMVAYVQKLLDFGVEPDQVRQMLCLNPARLLGLE